MNYKEKITETQFFKRVTRPAMAQVLTLEQLNIAGVISAEIAAPAIAPLVSEWMSSLTSIFKRSSVARSKPPLLSILPIIVLLMAGGPAMAQELHLSAGYNGSRVNKPGLENWKGRAGYQFGLDALIGHRWFIKPGVHYVQRSLSYAFSGDTLTTSEHTYKSRAVAIPVMLGTYFLDPEDIKSFNAYILAGPTALIGLNADLGNEVLTVETRSTQWYLGIGLGLSFGPVFIEGGYNAAMSNVFKGEGLDTNPKVNSTYVVGGVRLILAK